MIITTNLTTGASNTLGIVTVNPTNTAGIWSPGVGGADGYYQLLSYTNLLGQGLSNISLGTVLGIGGNRQTATLVPDPSNANILDLKVHGDTVTWTGAQNTNWTTTPVGGSQNWKLTTALTPDEFMSADAVIFPDTTGTTTNTVNISDASVAAGAVVFSNTSGGNPYVITASNPAFGISGNGVLRLNGTGSVTINTANSFAGGVFVSAAGALNIGNAAALGSGPLTLNAALATVNNTSGSPVTLTNSSITAAGSFTFTGSSSLSTGSGTVTLLASPTITVNANTLTIPGFLSGSNFTITKAGAGKLVLGANNTGPNANYGGLTISNGVLELQGNYVDGDGQTTTVGQNATTGGVLRVSNGATFLANNGGIGVRSLDVGSVAGAAGAIQLSGNSTVSALSEVHLGRNTGSYGAITMDSGSFTSGSFFEVGNGTNGRATVNMTGGTLTVGISRMEIGGGGGAIGVVNVGGTAILNATSVTGTNGAVGGVNIANSTTGIGVINISGSGRLNVDPVGVFNLTNSGAGALGVVNLGIPGVGGGTLAVPAVAKNANASSIGNVNFNGGTLKAVANNGNFLTATNATVYSGGGTIDDSGFAVTVAQALVVPTGNGLTSAGLTIANGGIPYIDAPIVTISGGGGIGATAVANIDYSTGLLTGITITNPGTGYSTSTPATFALSGGGIGNTSTVTVSNIATNVVANSTTGGINKIGSGTLTLSSNGSTFAGGLTLANGALNINANNAIGVGAFTLNGGSFDNTSGGTVTVPNTVTQNWNTDVVFGGTNALAFGTGAVTMNGTRTVTTNGTASLTVGGAIGGPASAGLNKSGPGRLNLSGTSTYTGATNVTQGKLALSGTGAINTSSGITVSNGATFVSDSSVPVQPVVHVTGSGVDGTGTINTVNVDDNANTFVANGDGTASSLTIGALTFSGASSLNLTASAANLTTAATPVASLIVSGTNGLTTGAAGKIVKINASNTAVGWANGTYEFVSYAGAIQGAGFADFQLGTITGLTPRQVASASIANPSGLITFQVSGDSPVWTGAR